MGSDPAVVAALVRLLLSGEPAGAPARQPTFDGGDGCVELSAEGPRPCQFTFGPPTRGKALLLDGCALDGGSPVQVEARLGPCLPIGPGHVCPCEITAPPDWKGRAELRASSPPLNTFLDTRAPLVRDLKTYWAAPGSSAGRKQLPVRDDAGWMKLRLGVAAERSPACADTLTRDAGTLSVVHLVELR